MTYSLNEVDAMAKRAVRGAGYDWGVAEDMAQAVRWLCARDLDGIGALARALSAGIEIMPLMALIDTGGRREISHDPLLTLACGALHARQSGQVLRVDWGTAGAVTDGKDVEISGDMPPGPAPAGITSGGPSIAARDTTTRVQPKPADWAILARFAHKTYAPATEDSRRLGAGAGVSDND